MSFRQLDPTTAAAAPVVAVAAPLSNVGETLGTLRADLLLSLSSRTDPDTARLNRWVNKGYRSLVAMLKLSELKASLRVNLVIGQPFYLMPIQVRSIRQISMPDAVDFARKGVKLLLSDEDEYRRQPDLTGTPVNWFRYGRMVVVYPDPTTIYPLDVDFWIRPDDMTLDSHSPILPQEFHESIMLAARYKAWRDLRNYKEAALAKNDLLAELRPLIDTDGEEASEAPRGLTVARKASDLTRARR